MPEQQRAVAHHVADELVTVGVPLARARPGRRPAGTGGEAHVMGHAAGQQPPGAGMQGR